MMTTIAPAPPLSAVARVARVPDSCGPVGRVSRAVLGVPLPLKLAGTNVVILLAALIVASALRLRPADLVVLIGGLLGSFALSTVLVVLALAPVRALEQTARWILGGNLTARVRTSVLADSDMRRVANTMNRLLDSLASERQRIRDLAVRVVEAQDDAHAHMARELEDSTAQRLAALLYEVRGTLDRTTDPDLRRRLELWGDMTSAAIEDLRSITNAVYPRVLTDLGLVPALEWLARGVRRRHDISVAVQAPHPCPRVRPVVAAAMFRAAATAVESAVDEARAKHVTITLKVDRRRATLEIENDGTHDGASDRLSALRERVGLVDGDTAAAPRAHGGSIVTVTLPIDGA